MSAESTFNDLPPIAKTAIIFVGLGTFGFIGWKIYQGVKQRVDLKEERREDKDIDKAITDLRLTNIKPTLTNAQLSIMADQLQAAFDGIGTDFTAIKNVFSKVKNEADQLLLIKKFGIRKIKSGIIFVSDPSFTLGQAITDELGASSTQVLASVLSFGIGGFFAKNETDELNQMLAKKGIKTLF